MIIGISGFINSGKGTVGSYLTDQFGFRKDSFATSLKDACSLMFDWPRDMLEGETMESRMWREVPDEWWSGKLGIPDFSPRLALQLIGTNVLRHHFNESMWFLTLENRIRKNISQDVVISDVRFPNEIKFIRDHGGVMLRVNRGPLPVWYDIAVAANDGDISAKERMVTEYPDAHLSEWAWCGSEFDFEINNNTTIKDLNIQVEGIIKHGISR